MTPAFEELQKQLKQLPGLGYRSAERIAINLLIEHPDRLTKLVEALLQAAKNVKACPQCGNVAEGELCSVCADPRRANGEVCVVEHVQDLAALERAGAFSGTYHVLHGKLSPLNGVGPEDLNLEGLNARVAAGSIRELILALSNDVEGEATCHYLKERLPAGVTVGVTRIGFGLPSGGGVIHSDAVTLRTALQGRREFV